MNAARTEASQRLTQVLGDIGRGRRADRGRARPNDARLEAEHDELTQPRLAAEAVAARPRRSEVTAAQAAVDTSEATLARSAQRHRFRRGAGAARRGSASRNSGNAWSGCAAAPPTSPPSGRSCEAAIERPYRARCRAPGPRRAAGRAGPAAEPGRRSGAGAGSRDGEAESGARSRWQQQAEARAQLSAEQRTLAKLLTANQSDLWPPILERRDGRRPDTRRRWASALGDDLTASAAAGALIRWEALPPLENAAPLPEGAAPLSRFVQGHAALQRRLRQIGVVETDAEGNRLAPSLAQGQRLVTRHGALWRWDGFRDRGRRRPPPPKRA